MVNIIVGRDGRQQLLGSIKKVHQEAAEEEQHRLVALGQHREKAQRMVGNVARSVPVEVVTLIVIPIVAINEIMVIADVCREIKCISAKVVRPDGIVVTG